AFGGSLLQRDRAGGTQPDVLRRAAGALFIEGQHRAGLGSRVRRVGPLPCGLIRHQRPARVRRKDEPSAVVLDTGWTSLERGRIRMKQPSEVQPVSSTTAEGSSFRRTRA